MHHRSLTGVIANPTISAIFQSVITAVCPRVKTAPAFQRFASNGDYDTRFHCPPVCWCCGHYCPARKILLIVHRVIFLRFVELVCLRLGWETAVFTKMVATMVVYLCISILPYSANDGRTVAEICMKISHHSWLSNGRSPIIHLKPAGGNILNDNQPT
jgi:hypothetical protein